MLETVASLTMIMGCPCCMAFCNVAMGSCRWITSHSVIAQLVGGSVIRQYKVRCGTAAGGSGAAMAVIGRAMVIVYFFNMGVTGTVSGGMLFRGHRSTL